MSASSFSKRAVPKPRKGSDGRTYYVFYSKYHIFSNFYPLDGLKYDDHIFFSSEQLYFYMKAMFFEDTIVAGQILKAKTPADAKNYSYAAEGHDFNKWTTVSQKYMTKANIEKYSQFPELKEALLNTKDGIIVEASPTDKHWGIGMSMNCDNATDPTKWQGKNMLGEVLMDVRKLLQ